MCQKPSCASGLTDRVLSQSAPSGHFSHRNDPPSTAAAVAEEPFAAAPLLLPDAVPLLVAAVSADWEAAAAAAAAGVGGAAAAAGALSSVGTGNEPVGHTQLVRLPEPDWLIDPVGQAEHVRPSAVQVLAGQAEQLVAAA